MSRLLRVGDKVINLDNIEYITREESSVVRIHFVHRDIELWNEQGEAFRQWVLSNAGYCEGLWRRLVGVGIIGTGLLGAPALLVV